MKWDLTYLFKTEEDYEKAFEELKPYLAKIAEYANSARTETPQQAALLDDKLIRAWSGHPHFRVIDNSTDFDEKMNKNKAVSDETACRFALDIISKAIGLSIEEVRGYSSESSVPWRDSILQYTRRWRRCSAF